MYKALGMIVLLLGLSILAATHQQDPSHDKERPTEPSTGAVSAPNPPPNQTQPKQERTERQEEIERLYEFVRWPEGITALAIILTLGAIVWQSDETRRSAKAMEQSVMAYAASQAPQIVVSSHGDPRKDLFSDTPRVVVEIRNNGPTAAYDVIQETWIEVLPFQADDFTENAYTFKLENKMTIYPQQDPVTLNIPLGRKFSGTEPDEIRSLRKKVCVRVKVSYRDTFMPNRRQYADFGYVLQADGFGFMSKYNNSGTEKNDQPQNPN